MIAFIPLGFIYANIRYWQVRNALAKHKFMFNRWRVGLISAMIIAIICSIPGFRDTVGFLLGVAILALFGLYIMLRRYLTRIRKYMKYTR